MTADSDHEAALKPLHLRAELAPAKVDHVIDAALSYLAEARLVDLHYHFDSHTLRDLNTLRERAEDLLKARQR